MSTGPANAGRDGKVVAVDGPAAAGKSSTSRLVAERLGFCHVNSGLLYRAITWAASRGGWKVDDADFEERVRELDLEVLGEETEARVRVEGDDPGSELRSREVSARVSEVSAQPVVRERVLAFLREAARELDLVCDGRDIGTVVFPDADLKIFLTCSAEERARRRLLEYGEEPTPERIRDEAALLRARDVADSTRALAPLRKAEDAVEVDTTSLTQAEAVDRIVALARERGLEGS